MSLKCIKLFYNLALYPNRKNEVHMTKVQLCLQQYNFSNMYES